MIPVDGAPQRLDEGFPIDRVLRRIESAIKRFELDLAGRIVLTEAATGYYRVTPILAAMAGADRVIAVAKSSRFGSRQLAKKQVARLAELAGVSSRVEPTFRVARDVCHGADIITNLGSVRPIDEDFISRLGVGAVVSLMFDARDARPADIDTAALRRAAIPLCAVDEDAIGLFRWTGQRIAWWLTELGLEIVDSRIIVWGGDPRARQCAQWLRGAGAVVERVDRTPKRSLLDKLDALVLMTPGARVTASSRVTPRILAAHGRGVAILECAGEVDREECAASNLPVYPPLPPSAGHVGRTIGEILYAPVIELHAAGLRVAQAMSDARCRGASARQCEAAGAELPIGQRVPRPR